MSGYCHLGKRALGMKQLHGFWRYWVAWNCVSEQRGTCRTGNPTFRSCHEAWRGRPSTRMRKPVPLSRQSLGAGGGPAVPLATSTRMRSPKYREPSLPFTASMASLHRTSSVSENHRENRGCQPTHTEDGRNILSNDCMDSHTVGRQTQRRRTCGLSHRPSHRCSGSFHTAHRTKSVNFRNLAIISVCSCL